MLGFLRERAKMVVWVILLFLVGTLIAGAAYYYLTKPEQKRTLSVSETEIGQLGDQPIDVGNYQKNVQEIIARAAMQMNGNVSPEILDFLNYQAFLRTVQYTALLEKADELKIKVSRKEMKQATEQVLKTYQFANKDALKKKLKQNGIAYSEWETSLKNDLKIQKLIQALQSQVQVTDQDVENKYTQITAYHIVSKDEKKIQKAQAALKSGMTFAKAVHFYSEDSLTKPNGGLVNPIGLDYFGPNFEQATYALDEGEVSHPVQTEDGYHLIYVSEKQRMPKPQDYAHDKEKQQVLADKRNRIVARTIDREIRAKKLVINDPMLQAFKYKTEGKWMESRQEYQKLISRNPSNPLPHYLIAGTFLAKKETLDDAKTELQKAVLKGELTNNPVTTYAYLLLGSIAKEKGARQEMVQYYDRAMETGKDNPVILQELHTRFTALADGTRIEKVKKYLEDWKVKEEIRRSAAEAAQKQAQHPPK